MQTKTKNRLWIARNRAGYELKHVAHLISHKTPDLISRYEQGLHLPGLEIAFKFEILYKMPVQKLFKELYKKCRGEVRTIKQGNRGPHPGDIYKNGTKRLRELEFCSYDEFLKSNIPNEIERNLITKHIIRLNNTVNKFKGHTS